MPGVVQRVCDGWERIVGGLVRMLPLPSAEVSTSWWDSLINMMRDCINWK